MAHMAPTDERIEVNFDDLNQVADQLDGYANALESAHGDGIADLRAAVSDDVKAFTLDNVDSPIYADLKDAVLTACTNEEASMVAVITNTRNYAKFFRDVAKAHSDQESRNKIDLSKIEVPEYQA